MSPMMKQAVLDEPKSFQFQEVPVPVPKKGEALLKMKAIGICGSDIHTYLGKHPFVHTPVVLGHESSGEIISFGPGDHGDLKIGDRVVLRPQRTCGTCRPCREGRYNICEKLDVLGCLSTGPSSEYFAVESSILYKIPDFLSYAAGTVLEPLAVGIHAVKRAGDPAGKNVLVCGAGTIGNVVAQAAKGLGAANVIITDVSDYKLDLAQTCQINHTVNVKDQDLGDAVNNILDGDQIDLILECSAVESVLNQAIDIAPKGISIIIVGVFEDMPKVDMAAVQDREYSLIGTLMYTHEDYMDAIRLAAEKKADLQNLITKTFPFDEYGEAYRYVENNRSTVQKVVIEMPADSAEA